MVRRKDGRFQETVTINGKRKYFYGKSKAEVLRKIREHKEAAERGPLFETVAEEWWDEAEAGLANNTVKCYQTAISRACAEFKGFHVKDITPMQIDSAVDDLGRQGYAAKTVRIQLLIYNMIFRYAVKKGYIQVNPAREIRLPKNLPKTKRTSPSPDDIRRVKESTGCTFGLFAFWAMYTGLRKGELLALTWDDVDLENRTIRVDKSICHVENRPIVKSPKTEASISTVPILDVLAKKISPSKGIVFPNEKGEYLTDSQFRKLWSQYREESGVTATMHQFRHAYATMLFEAEIPPEEMQVLLRHAHIQTTMDVYRDIRENKIKSIHSKVLSIDIVPE